MTARIISKLTFSLSSVPLSLVPLLSLSQTAKAHPANVPHLFHFGSELSYVLIALAVMALGCAIMLFRKLIMAFE